MEIVTKFVGREIRFFFFWVFYKRKRNSRLGETVLLQSHCLVVVIYLIFFLNPDRKLLKNLETHN
jgi:hypothetical protein